VTTTHPPADGSVAIIGMAGRFPAARNVEEFWRLSLRGTSAISRFTAEELAAAGVVAEVRANPAYVPAAGVLDGIEWFDAPFFGMSRREAELTDPQHRLFLEVAWEALEVAGCDPARYPGAIGVFASCSLSTYLLFNLAPRLGIAGSRGYLDALIGNDKDYLAPRVAYKFDLRGPAIGVQTACSSSLVAIHVACQSLLNCECDVAIAGGAAINVPHRTGYLSEEGGYLSPEGVCRPFDAAACGTVFGSGVGAVVLKRLSEAVADGDVIDAVILGSAVNNDGARKAAFTAPNADTQAAAARQAVASAGIDPRSVAYVEAHGTGTPVGDPAEAEALARAYRPAGGSPLRVGSAKGSVGHLDSAAGVAGTIRAALALGRGAVPPTAGLSRVAAGVKAAGVKAAGQPARWPGTLRRAGVAGLGIGGTNAHLVMESPPERPSAPRPGPGPWLLTVSARSPLAARELARAYADRVSAGPERVSELCYSAALRRHHHTHRAVAIGRTRSELAAALRAIADGDQPAQEAFTSGPTVSQPVFVFSGMGPRWRRLGRLIRRVPAFAAVIDACDQELARQGADWSIADMLDRPDVLNSNVARAQVSLFALQAGLVSAWRGLGVVPSAVVGHSAGEVAAAWACGALGLGEALGLAVRRGRALARSAGAGAMAAVGLPAAEVDEALARWGGRVTVAAENGPRLTVISGESAAVAEALRELAGRGVWGKQLATGGVAGHSQLLEPHLDELAAAAAGVHPGAMAVPMVSTVTGRVVTEGELSGDYWVRNARNPVRFAGAMDVLLAEHQGFLEFGPRPALVGGIPDLAAAHGRRTVAVASLCTHRDPYAALLTAVGQLYSAGAALDWAGLYPTGGRYMRLPAYPWQRQRYWIDSAPAAVSPGRRILGTPSSSQVDPSETVWEVLCGPIDAPHLQDHRLAGRAVMPAAAYIEAAVEGVTQRLGAGPLLLTDIRYPNVCPVPDAGDRVVELAVGAAPGGSGTFRVSSGRTVHAAGSFTRLVADGPSPTCPDLSDGWGRSVRAEDLYRKWALRGVDYGPAFRAVRQCRVRPGEVLGLLQVPGTSEAGSGWRVHPVLLDSALQLLAAPGAGPVADSSTAYVPVGVDAIRVMHPITGECPVLAHGAFRPADAGTPAITADVTLFDEGGNALVQILGLQAVPFQTAPRPVPDGPCYRVAWVGQPLDSRTPEGGERTPIHNWVVLADQGGVGERVATRLRAAGDRVSVIDPLAAPDQVLSVGVGVDPTSRLGVVFLRALDGSDGTITPEILDSAQEQGCHAALRLVQALGSATRPHPPRVWLVTRSAQPVADGVSVPGLAQAPLWGFGRTVSLEHPELHCTRVDLDAAAGDGVEELVRELRTEPAGEDAVAWRGGSRLVARLVPFATDASGSAPIVRGDGAYLITGGLGGLGMEVARWLARQGARHIVLVGRTPGPPTARAAIRELKAGGVRVIVERADVARAEDVAAVLDRIRTGPVPLRGVVHAAGVFDDGTVLTLDWPRVRDVLAPKVRGGWNLHDLTRDDPLDFFVLFSSAGSLVGSPGQGAYAAANAFLDALAHQRRAEGRVSLSVNWGPWAVVGSAARSGRTGPLAGEGVESLSPEAALDALPRLLRLGVPQAGVMRFDVARWALAHPQAAAAPFLSAVVPVALRPARPTPAEWGAVAAAVSDLPAGWQRLARMEQYVTDQLALTFGRSADEIDPRQPLKSLGLDSLRALEFRNRLEVGIGRSLAVALVWRHPTVRGLAAALTELVGLTEGPSDRADVGRRRDATRKATGGPGAARRGSGPQPAAARNGDCR
jgi:myxalamid-type polyketide synthase MxaE and MxaD